jgi:putative (di)nucleoside polyphosphate hydrolase
MAKRERPWMARASPAHRTPVNRPLSKSTYRARHGTIPRMHTDTDSVVDADGFRPNVGIVVANDRGQVLWARRIGGHDAWQFPQGGIHEDETPEDALYRELHEEVGLEEHCVKILACTTGWLRYRLPKRLRRYNSAPDFKGQKQKWFLLKMVASDDCVCVTRSGKPEFDDWRWVSYWYPVSQVVEFKRDVYRQALKELAPRLVVAARR